ncbi:hypothetical protein F5Y19DRAFT_471089 [Xylariaceae sp. FL1651]|nr:hypothetical protein F5Y19DRAFT_471089 [Xylariaceae sp. FL1651]
MASVYQDLLNLLFNPRHSDLTIACQDGIEMKVNRVVVTLHSPVLASMISEYRDDRAQTILRIELPDVEFDTLYMIMQFLYGGNYNDYENTGSLHSPSYVIFMTSEEIDAKLQTLPCLEKVSSIESTSTDGDYENGRHLDSLEYESSDDDKEDEEDDEEEGCDEKSFSDGNTQSEPGSSSQCDEVEDSEHDRRTREFQGHNLFDSLRVYCLASRFGIAPLQLLARDRFYRTAEKVLMYTPDDSNNEAHWRTHNSQRAYKSQLAKAIYNDFPKVLDELYQTVPESDTMMRLIPPLLIAAGYNNDAFRDKMKPLLEKYPNLALAVLECMRTPYSQE